MLLSKPISKYVGSSHLLVGFTCFLYLDSWKCRLVGTMAYAARESAEIGMMSRQAMMPNDITRVTDHTSRVLTPSLRSVHAEVDSSWLTLCCSQGRSGLHQVSLFLQRARWQQTSLSPRDHGSMSLYQWRDVYPCSCCNGMRLKYMLRSKVTLS